jgi:hypothetical protein
VERKHEVVIFDSGRPHRFVLHPERGATWMRSFLVWRVRLWVGAAALVFIATGHGQRPEAPSQLAEKAPQVSASTVCAAVGEKAGMNCGTRLKQSRIGGQPLSATL